MSLITYAQFKTQVNSIVFPEGEAPNLSAAHDSYLQNGLIFMQDKIKCLRQFHVDFFGAWDAEQACDVAYLNLPRGAIKKVVAFKPGAECTKFEYRPVGTNIIAQWIREHGELALPFTSQSEVGGNDFCYANYALVEEDDTYWRCLDKIYSIAPGCKLLLAPRFPCGYVVAVQWSGTKRKWNAYDMVPDDSDLVDAVALYLEGERALRLDLDRDKHARIMGEEGDGVGGTLGSRMAGMISRCKEEQRLPRRDDAGTDLMDLSIAQFNPIPYSTPYLAFETETADITVEPCGKNPTSEAEFVAFGDGGYDNDYQRQVSDLVRHLEPEFLVLLGDLNYPNGETATMYPNLLKRFSQWIPNKAYPVWGNHDVNNALQDGSPLMSVFPNIGALNFGKKYYHFVHWPVHFFMVNSGYSSGTPREADGIVCSSAYGTVVQYNYIAAAIAASTAPWKVLCMHRAGYMSETTYNPGASELQCWYDLGVDMVLTGHAHAYERMYVSGVVACTVGTGASPLRAFGTPIAESQFRYNEKHGVLRVQANEKRLQGAFYNVDRQVIDSFAINK